MAEVGEEGLQDQQQLIVEAPPRASATAEVVVQMPLFSTEIEQLVDWYRENFFFYSQRSTDFKNR